MCDTLNCVFQTENFLRTFPREATFREAFPAFSFSSSGGLFARASKNFYELSRGNFYCIESFVRRFW